MGLKADNSLRPNDLPPRDLKEVAMVVNSYAVIF